MSETIPPVLIACKCGNHLYELVYVEGIPLARVGGGYCRTLRGICKRCKTAYSYSISDQQISKAVIAHEQINSGDE